MEGVDVGEMMGGIGKNTCEDVSDEVGSGAEAGVSLTGAGTCAGVVEASENVWDVGAACVVVACVVVACVAVALNASFVVPSER